MSKRVRDESDNEEGNNNKTRRLSRKQKLKLKKAEELAQAIEKHKDTTETCYLCGDIGIFFHYGHDRPYYRCNTCDLIYVPESARIAETKEAEIYERHKDDYQHSGFHKFISQMTDPLIKILKARGQTPAEDSLEAKFTLDKITGNEPWATIGMDYGSGPGPIVERIMTNNHFIILNYDPYAFPSPQLLDETADSVQETIPVDSVINSNHKYHAELAEAFKENFSELPQALKAQYAFVTVTEVLKNIRNPLFVWQHLHSITKPGGIVACLNSIYIDTQPFEQWHYHRDETHIVFYTPKTLEYVEKLFNWKLVNTQNKSVFFFQKN